MCSSARLARGESAKPVLRQLEYDHGASGPRRWGGYPVSMHAHAGGDVPLYRESGDAGAQFIHNAAMETRSIV